MKRLFSREFLTVVLPAVLIGAGAFSFALRYVKPAPPQSFVLSAANKTSPYYLLALRFKEEAAKKGVMIELRESTGSLENLGHLKDPNSDVQAGFVQGGLTSSIDSPNLFSMGRLITEPVWIFYRGTGKLDSITQLKGKRVLTGPAGSGTSIPALKLLEANGVTAENTTLISMPLRDYASAFSDGAADAGFLVIGVEAAPVQALLRQAGTNLMSMSQADSLIQRYPYLSSVMLRRGVVNFAQSIPPVDTVLVATKAALLVRDDLQPALVTVLAQAILTVQGKPTLKPTGESQLFALGVDALADDPEFTIPDDARRVYKNGPTFFQRELPFWVATLLDRALILILPLIGIVVPLIRLVPIAYNWRMRRRILHWYRELKNLQNDLPKTAPLELVERKEKELERIEEGVWGISVPIQFSADLYNLRDHVEFVKRRIAHLRECHPNLRTQPTFVELE